MPPIPHSFRDEALLMQALTHPSYGAEYQAAHYERLEFLGDAVLELAVSQYLYRNHPDIDEGRLTRIRAALVCEASLADAARALELGERVRLSPGEERTGGRDKPSILSDVLEALIAAVYLDAGPEAAFSFVEDVLGDKLKDLPDLDADAKSALQEHLQKHNRPAPQYETLAVTGPAHRPQFTVRVTIDGQEIARGEGLSKQAAQQAAARSVLRDLKQKKRK